MLRHGAPAIGVHVVSGLDMQGGQVLHSAAAEEWVQCTLPMGRSECNKKRHAGWLTVTRSVMCCCTRNLNSWAYGIAELGPRASDSTAAAFCGILCQG